MNKLTLALALAALPLAASAQNLSAGTFQLSGATGLSFVSGEIDPEFGDDVDVDARDLRFAGLFYLTPQLGLGLVADYEYMKMDAPGLDALEQTSTVFGPIIGANVPLSPGVAAFLEAGIGLAQLEQDDVEADGVAFLLGGGLKLFPARSLSVDLGLNYRKTSLEADGGAEVDETSFAFTVGLSVYLGGR